MSRDRARKELQIAIIFLKTVTMSLIFIFVLNYRYVETMCQNGLLSEEDIIRY